MPLKVPMLFPGVPFGKQAVVCAKTLRTLLKILATKPSTLASMPTFHRSEKSKSVPCIPETCTYAEWVRGEDDTM